MLFRGFPMDGGRAKTSIMAAAFAGSFRWDLFHPYPEQSAKERAAGDAFIAKVRRVLEEYIDPGEVDRLGQIPEEALIALGELGCFGLRIPEKYGGLGMSLTTYNRVLAFIASFCNSTAFCLSAHQSVGAVEPLLLFGSEAQKEEYLPRLARGAISGLALTEPSVGSDPRRMKMAATPSEDGAFYLLNGEKLWCTNAPTAELLMVVAVTPPRIVRGKERSRLSAFIVETDAPGLMIAHVSSFMGVRGISSGLVRFRNVHVPSGNMIGAPGDGLRIALSSLNTGRLVLPSAAAASSKVCVHLSRDWCRNRVQWGRPIGKHQVIAEKAAGALADTFALESIGEYVCALADRGELDIRIEAALAKFYCSEAAWRIADETVQIRGGRGYETADSLGRRGEAPVPLERLLRDARAGRIAEGTTEMMRLVIAREVFDPHVRRLLPVTKGKSSGRWRSFWNAVRLYWAWYLRLWLPAESPGQARYLSEGNRKHLRYAARTTKRLARAMFHAMLRYRRKLGRRQIVMRALVDIGAELFAMGVVLARTEHLLAGGDRNATATASRSLQELANFFCVQARHRIGEHFRAIRLSHRTSAETVARAFMAGDYAWVEDGVYLEFASAAQGRRRRAETSQHSGEEGEIEPELDYADALIDEIIDETIDEGREEAAEEGPEEAAGEALEELPEGAGEEQPVQVVEDGGTEDEEVRSEPTATPPEGGPAPE